MQVNPEAAGLDPARLDNIRAHFERQYMEPGKLVGAQVAVARHGHVGYYEHFGLADRERNRPVAEDTIWRIYSMTKPITGVALMSLYEKGLFQLNDPIHRFIPEWRGMKVKERSEDGSTRLVDPIRPVTVRDALMHMTGLAVSPLAARTEGDSSGGGSDSFLDGDHTLESFFLGLAERPLDFQPGTRWIYGVSTDLCGRLVEIISGKRFDEYLREAIFEPLGMHDTGFDVPDDKVERFAASYGRARDKSLRLLEDPEQSPYRKLRSFLSGGGGLVSTLPDYLRFTRMLLNGGELDGVRILGRKTVELMTMNHLPGGGDMREFALPGGYGEVGFDGMGFGLTMAVALHPSQTGQIGSPGDYMWGGYASTTFWCDPTEDLTVVFMTQLIPSGTFNFRGQLKSLVYPALL